MAESKEKRRGLTRREFLYMSTLTTARPSRCPMCSTGHSAATPAHRSA